MAASEVDIAIVGAGAAGLMASIQAGRAEPSLRITALDGAKSLGAKILVAGGGRCNVTHHAVDERSFNGASPNAIKQILRRYPVEQTIDFFRRQGVELKREETGKLFPTTDKARTVLDALLAAAKGTGVEIQHPWRVERIKHNNDAFELAGEHGLIRARRIILAAGGRSLPKSGSDGKGFEIARSLGHTITPRVTPALVPLTLPREHILCRLSGLSAPVRLTVAAPSGKRLATIEGSLLCTHFGLSGPAAMDISRHLIDARLDDPEAALVINWLPDESTESMDQRLQSLGAKPVSVITKGKLPERLAHAIIEQSGVQPSTRGADLSRERRRRLATALTAMDAPIVGDRGYNYAEVTAGGVPLAELKLKTMESRVVPGLHMCGEICDVDGRIGGFNFQWAWASGFVAGTGAAAMCATSPSA